MEPKQARARFREIARSPDAAIDLTEAALVIAAEAYEDLDVGHYRARLEALSQEAHAVLASCRSARERVARLVQFLSAERGFRGNRSDYEDPRNSFLNEVIERTLGIPITLSLVYMEVGRRLELPIEGVGFPSHFLARCRGNGPILIDAFAGRIVTEHELLELLRRSLGPQARLEPAFLRRAAPREILVRMLSNLKHVYFRAGRFDEALRCCDRLLLLAPDAPVELRDRGIVYERLGLYAPAERDLERCLTLAPHDPSAPPLRRLLASVRERVGPVH